MTFINLLYHCSMYGIYFFVLTIILMLIIRIVYNRVSGKCSCRNRLDGKTVVITGATSGIGKVTAQKLAERGAKVVLACRNLEKAKAVADELNLISGKENAVIYELDTADLQSVRKCANEILKNEDNLHILINNAGIGPPSKKCLTSDGLELTMATNYYGHFLFTNLLLGLLMKSSPSRIINVSSVLHKSIRILNPEDLNFEKQSYYGYKAYGLSKLCNILFTQELSRKLKGKGVTANSLHPGVVDTEIFSKMQNGSFMACLYRFAVPVCAKTTEAGAQTTIHLALAEELEGVTGKYFVDCKEAVPSTLASHRGFAEKLWLASELDVKLEDNEIHYN